MTESVLLVVVLLSLGLLLLAFAAAAIWMMQRQARLADIAQAGCGQVSYGELVRQLRDDAQGPAASSLLRRVRRVLGEPMVVETAVAGDFPLERDRFNSASTPPNSATAAAT